MGDGRVIEFPSLGAFCEALERGAAGAHGVRADALLSGAKVIQAEARAILGHYQDAVGPFPAWEPLAPVTQTDRAEAGYTPNDPLRVTGALAANIEVSADANEAAVGVPHVPVGDGTPGNEARDIGVVAIVQEFGSGWVPERSFLGRAAYVARDRAAKVVVDIILAELLGGATPGDGR